MSMKRLPERLIESCKARGVKWWWREDVLFSVACAEAALPVFEQAHPNDKRPRLAIEAARKWLQNPTDQNICAAVIASSAAAWAAGMRSGTAAIVLDHRESDAAAAVAASFAASYAVSAASHAREAIYIADGIAANLAVCYAGEAGVSEPEILRAFAREVAGTPLAPIVTAEQL
jgi:hypothetical protein